MEIEINRGNLNELETLLLRFRSVARVIGESARVNAMIAAYTAENQMRERGGAAPAYGEAAFRELADSMEYTIKNEI